jgi:predicted DsbA family dithiol-disulfide isomerase
MTQQVETQTPQALRAEVFADFVCPWSYIAQHEVDRLYEEYGLEVEWRPHWLHPEVPPEGEPSPLGDPERRKAQLAWFKEMSPEMAGRMRFPERRQYSFLAFVGLEYAREHGRATPFRRAIYEALFVEGRDIAEVATLQDAAEKAGLDAYEMGLALNNPEYFNKAFEAVSRARELGITSTPTIILGRIAIEGWHYYEALQSVLEQQGVMPKAAD